MDGWETISGSAAASFPEALNHAWRQSNLKELVENDDLVADNQGSKLFKSLLAKITHEPDFDDLAAPQFKLNRALCKKMLQYLIEFNVARFPQQEEAEKRQADTDEDKEVLLEQQMKAALEFDEELAGDPSFAVSKKDKDARVKGTPILNMNDHEKSQIAAFTVIADRVVKQFAEEVRKYFPRLVELVQDRDRRGKDATFVERLIAPGVELPACTRKERRKVVYVANIVLDPDIVNSRRQLGIVAPSHFYFSDFVRVYENVFIGDAAGALHAGPAGFTLVINCASVEIVNFYEKFPSGGIEYISLPLPAGAGGISSMSTQDWDLLYHGIKRHKGMEGKKILIHGVEGRCRAAGVAFRVLRHCFGLPEEEAFLAVFRAVPHANFTSFPEQYVEHAFNAIFPVQLGGISFDKSIEHLRIRYGPDHVLPVTTLSPFYTFASGGNKCSIIDFLIEIGLKRLQTDCIVNFFANHIVRALVDLVGPIILVCYPAHSPGAESPLAEIIRAMCRMNSAQFFDGTHVLVRTKESPQRSKGGDHSIDIQRGSITCTLLQGAPPDATYVILDDVVNTGSSCAIAAEKLATAGVSGDNLRAFVIGRFTAHGPGHETVSDFVIPSNSVAADVSVSAPADTCIDVPDNFEALQEFGCLVLSNFRGSKTLAFRSSAEALSTARGWLDIGLQCCPHFAIEGKGFPAQLVSKADNVARVFRADAKALFVLDRVGDAHGPARNSLMQAAHQAWKELAHDERAKWDAKCSVLVTSEEIKVLLQKIYPAEGDGAVPKWELLKHGGGNLVQFSSKTAFNDAMKEKQFGTAGYRLERAFGTVRARVWVAASLAPDEALLKVQSLSDSHVICTLQGSSVTSQTLSKHDGGVLNVVGEKIRTEGSLTKRGCDVTWSPTMQFCDVSFLGIIGWMSAKKVFAKYPQWQMENGLFETAMRFLVSSLEKHCTVNAFCGMSAQEVPRIITQMLARKDIPRWEIDAVLPLFAMFHFSWKDVYRCMTYPEKLRGLSTAGGTLVHVALHIPDSPWSGKTEAQKTSRKIQELGRVSRESAPFDCQQAENRIAALQSMLSRLPCIDKDGLLMKQARAVGITSECLAKEKLNAAKNLMEACRQRLTVVRQVARELPSFANVPGHLSKLVGDLLNAHNHCHKIIISGLTHVSFPAEVDSQEGQVVLTAKWKKDLKKELDKLKIFLAAALNDLIQYSGGAVTEEPSTQVGPMEAAKSVRERRIALVFANDSGGDADCVTAIPEPLAFWLFEQSHNHNLASQDESHENEATPSMARRLLDHFRLNEHTLRFQLSSGLAKEARNSIKEEAKMAEYVKDKSDWIASACRSALLQDSGRAPLTSAGKRVAESLLKLDDSDSIMSAPKKFVGSSSAMRSLKRVESILLRSVALCEAYNTPLYRDARGRTRRGVDKIAQMQSNFMEYVALEYARDSLVQLMHRLSHGEAVDVLHELHKMVGEESFSFINVNDVLKNCPAAKAEHLPYLILKSCEVLHALQGSVVNYSKRQTHDKIADLRASWSRTGKDPPSVILCNGTWNRGAPGRGSFGSAWHRAEHQRATNRNLIRRAKQIRWHLKKKRLGQKSAVTNNFLSSVSIQSKRISEIRSTKQKLSFAAFFSHERINTQGPPQSLFPGLTKDRPWKLRWSKGDEYVVHRDHMASCALAILGMWERYAFAYNQIQELINASRCVLLRPAVYLYHTDYAKWVNGTLEVNKIQRW